MSNGAYAGLRLAARGAAMPEDDNDETCTDADCKKHGKGKKKDEQMTEQTTDTAVAEARAEATATANARFSTVLASEHYAGREALAKNLLASDLSSDAIVTALAASNPAPVAAAAVDTDAAARAEMRDALAESGNSNVDANAGAKPSAAQADNGAVWDRAIANINPGRKTA